MSYNGYNQYSPYWQQPASQTTPQSTAQNVGHSRASYQPLSAYQSNQQFSQPSVSQPAETSSSASYGSQGYGNTPLNGSGNGRPQDYRAAYTGTNDRASLDGATALGNLAYASSLGRDGSAKQVANNWQQGTLNYGTTSPYGINSTSLAQNRTIDERRESSTSLKESTNTSAQQATASPSFVYSANNATYKGPNPRGSTQTPAQYPQAHSTSEQHRSIPYSQPPRPTSGQAIQQPRSGPDSQTAPSATTPATQGTVNQSQSRNDRRDSRGTTPTRVQTPQQASNKPSSSQKAGSKVDTSRQASKPATPVESQYTTVDPSQVFNHVEYSRRQAAAAAEVAAAKKVAEEAEAVRFAATQTKLPQAGGTSRAASAPNSEPDSAKKDQMELEMKQMIEKMRDYKAKDPSLFTQIWEQVKKSQPPQSAPSQLLQGSTTSPMVVNPQSQSPSLIQSQLPSESDLPVGDDFPPDFDRGRFPAQRRRRGGGGKTSTSRKSGAPKGSTEATVQTENQAGTVPPEIAIPKPKVGQIFPDPGRQSVQQAMQQFNNNSKSPGANSQHILEHNEHSTTNTPIPPPKVTLSTAASSQPVPAKSAPPPKPGATYWPESKKEALADAARNALISAAANHGKTITTQEIHGLLDTNPSYTQMCEILEYRGFVIDRGQFARVLLKAVPDLGSASNPANSSSANSANADGATSTHNLTPSDNSSTRAASAAHTAGSFRMLVKAPSYDSKAQTKPNQPVPYSVPPKAVASQAPNSYVTPYPLNLLSAEEVHKGSQSNAISQDYRFTDPANWTPDNTHRHASDTYQSRNGQALHPNPPHSVYQQPGYIAGQVLDANGWIHPNGVIPHPTKQEMARKRTFDEIVNLTQSASDEDENERHRAKPRTDDERASGFSKFVNNNIDQVTWRQQNSGRGTPKPFKYKYSGRDALLQSYDIVEPMNKRRDALRRSMYNPKTIARDILLGIGRHPTMPPLNAHLEVLRERFKAVDNESDLSTFRWDLVDPETEANTRPSDTDDEDAFPAMNAGNRQRPAPAPAPAPTAVMVKNDSGDIAQDDQAASRKRGPYKKAVMRSGVQPIGSADTSERQTPYSSPYIQDMSNTSGNRSRDLSRFAYNSPNTAQTDSITLVTPNSSTSGTATRRKGRPPGAKNKLVRPDKGIPKKPKTFSMSATSSTAKEEPFVQDIVGNTTPNSTTSIRKTSAAIPTRPHINTSTPSKPSKLRNSISAITPTGGIAVVISSRSPSVVVTPQASAKKGKPRTAEDRSEDRSNGTPFPSTPTFTMYRCHWENCPAELHSLETLKKHVRKHRRAVDGVYPCLWADCSDSSNPISYNSQNEDSQYQRLKFKTDAEWARHVEVNHLGTEREVSAGLPGSGSIRERSDSSSNGAFAPVVRIAERG